MKIAYVSWPDGKPVESSATILDESKGRTGESGYAVHKAIREWLPETYFPGLSLHPYYGDGRAIWEAMQRAGFKLHTVETTEE